MKTDLVFKLMNLEIRKQPSFLECGQVKDDFKDGSAPFSLRVSSPDLCEDRGSDGSNDGSSIPVVLVEKSTESTRTFNRGVLGFGVAIRFEECCHQRIESLLLVVGGEKGLDVVEYGPGFLVQRTISLLVGT
jgi:hypothetical protein